MDEKWFDKFEESLNVLFTEQDFLTYSNIVKKDLRLYSRYLKAGSKVLYLGCGLGCTAIPLSKEGFKVVGIDNDLRVIEAAKYNGKKYGKDIEFKLLDVFDIDKKFKKDSFDACISGGLLEHFSKDQIKILITKQFLISPLIVCSMPVRTKATLTHYRVRRLGNKEVCCDSIKRNLWTKAKWIEDILRGYNIVESKVIKADSKIGNFDELFLVIRR